MFETGYGPSGLPHIGTFGEVARTSWVRHAFTELTGLPSRLIAFSDDMDGLRKVPDNVPNRDMLAPYLGKPLTRIPDPFGTHDSFGAHNNARLRAFLDSFGFEYEFASSTDYYAAGRFDAALIRVLECYDEVMAVILPTLGPERRATYSPILPIHPRTGLVMQVPMERRDPAAGTVVWRDPDSGEAFETSVKGGACKLQWKADWAMRWYALDVDYEMSGKDLIDSVRLSGRICRILGSPPPEGFTYELFLDEHGAEDQQVEGQRPVGRGMAALRAAREPGAVHVQRAAARQAAVFRRDPARGRRISRQRRQASSPVRRGAADQSGLAHPCRPPAEPRRQPGVVRHAAQPRQRGERRDARHPVGLHPPLQPRTRRPKTMPFLDRLVDHAIAYYRDFVRPEKRYRHPTDTERAALADLAETLRGIDPGRRCRGDPDRRLSRSASATRSPNCAPGSAASTRCCSASRKARASAASSRCTASPRPSR